MRITIISSVEENKIKLFSALKKQKKKMGVDFDLYKDNFEKSKIVFIFDDTLDKQVLIKKIKSNNLNSLIIYVCSSFASLNDSYIFEVDDYVLFDEFNNDAIITKIKRWLEFVTLRLHNEDFIKDGKNAFGVKVWDRKTRFSLSNESSLELLWEFFIDNRSLDRVLYANHWTQACYSVCLKLVQNNITPTIYFEENKEYYFLTISSLPFEDKSSYEDLIECAKLYNIRAAGHSYKKSKGVLSIYLKKDLVGMLTVEHNKLTTKAKERFQEFFKNSTTVCAREYVKECKISKEDLMELTEIEQEMKGNMVETDNQLLQVQIYGKFFLKFSQTVSALLEFKELTDVIQGVGNILLTLQDVKHSSKALFFADLIRQDLSLWHNHIFIAQDAQNIHYLDASLSSSCQQMKSCFTAVDERTDDELELF